MKGKFILKTLKAEILYEPTFLLLGILQNAIIM